MANLDFYAVADDLRDLVRFLFSETDITIYELASQHNCDPRKFRSLSELESAFQLGSYRSAYLQLWSPSVMKTPVISRIEMSGVPGNPFRFDVGGAGLIQLYLNGLKDGVIYHTHYGHWNEAGAHSRSIHPASDCDWSALRKLSGRIQRHIQGSLASGKLYARPILRHAFAAVQQGAGLWWGPQVHHADSNIIITKGA